MAEEWKSIKNWEDLYEVSNLGNIKNIKTNKLLKGDINNYGYHRVCLYHNNKKKRYFRHRLVAEHFIHNDDIENKKFVNHIDGDKSNNTVDNLEWVTQSENEKHAFKTGLKNKTNKPFAVRFDDGHIEYFQNQDNLAKRLRVTQQKVSSWMNNKSKTYEYFGILYFMYI